MDFPFSLRDFFNNLTMYHYLFFVLSFIASICFIILGIVYRKKHAAALFFYTVSFFGLMVAPIIGSYYIEDYLHRSTLKNIEILRLTYTKAIVFNADIQNEGKSPLKATYISLCMVKKNKNSILEFFNSLRAAHVQKFTYKMPIDKGSSEHMRAVIDTTKIANPSDYSVFYQIKSF